MPATKLQRKQQQRGRPKMTRSAASAGTTPASANLPIRRVSDPDITAERPHHPPILVSGEDATSVASSSSSTASYDDDDTASIQHVTQHQNSSAYVGPSNISGVKRSAPRVSVTLEEDTSLKKSKTQHNIDTQPSFQDLFQRWHTNRVVKRRHPSVNAFPALKPFEGFHDTNKAPGGYSFGPYFDCWYAKQQERAKDSTPSSPPSRKRPAVPSTDIGFTKKVVVVSPKDTTTTTTTTTTLLPPLPPPPPLTRPAKKLKSQNATSLTAAAATTVTPPPSTTTTTTTCSIQQQRNLNSLHKWNAANALYRSKIVELPDSFVPGPFTVIMGRRLKAPGCVHLRHLTDQYAMQYKLGDARQKSRIVTNILTRIYSKAPIGAFVRCKAGRYYEVEDLIAREKIVSELVAGGLQLFFARKGIMF